jgi:hypothetical protein
MAVKSTKEKKTATPKNGVVKAEKSSKTSSKKNDDDEEEDAHASDEDDDLEETDDWGKTEEDEDSWDPDFAEFDLPKTTKKAGKSKKGDDETDDLDLDLNLEEDDLFEEKDEFDDDF